MRSKAIGQQRCGDDGNTAAQVWGDDGSEELKTSRGQSQLQ